jgi:hypothetical protein
MKGQAFGSRDISQSLHARPWAESRRPAKRCSQRLVARSIPPARTEAQCRARWWGQRKCSKWSAQRPRYQPARRPESSTASSVSRSASILARSAPNLDRSPKSSRPHLSPTNLIRPQLQGIRPLGTTGLPREPPTAGRVGPGLAPRMTCRRAGSIATPAGGRARCSPGRSGRVGHAAPVEALGSRDRGCARRSRIFFRVPGLPGQRMCTRR